jgi:hypothetical protein
MPPLRELQNELLEAVCAVDGAAARPAAAPRVAVPPRIVPAHGLLVYRANVRANFLDSLHSSFPALWRLVGEEYFRQLAREFQRVHPSRSGDLLHVGAPFPAFVAERHRGGGYDYLGDVARFEWLCQEALLASDHAPLDLERLRSVAPADYDALRFELHPGLRLFASPYPVRRIWEVNVTGEDSPEIVDLDAGGESLALLAPQLELKFHDLSAGEFAFFESLRGGAAFGPAIEAASARDDAFDAVAALQRAVGAAIIVDFVNPGA